MIIKTHNYRNKKYADVDDLMKTYVKLRLQWNGDYLTENKLTEPNHYIYVKKRGADWLHCTKADNETVLVSMEWIQRTYPDPHHLDYDDVDTIDLEDHEKFHDDNGDVVEIEVRGVKECDKCFFRVKDIEKEFEMPRLQNNIIHKGSRYEKGKDFVYLNEKFAQHSYPQMYLTYSGVLRVLFASHTKLCDGFLNWATKTLFTAQMGSEEDRIALASNIIGATYGQVREVLSKASVPVSCIYLVRIGLVKDLRKSMNIDSKYSDDLSVFKYGLTNNLIRRMQDHQNSCGKIPGASITLHHYSLIDETFVKEAENSLSNRFDLIKSKLAYKNHKELIILDKTELKQVYKEYDEINKLYCCKMAYVNELIKEEHHRNRILELEKEVILKDMIIMQQRHDAEILKLNQRISALENDK